MASVMQPDARAIVAHQLAVAQNHLFWNTAKEMEYRKWKRDGPHSRTVIATSRCLSIRVLGGEARHTLNAIAHDGLCIVDNGIVKWPCSHNMRFH